MIAVAILLMILPPAARGRVDLEFSGLPMTPRLEASAMREVTAIWSQYGVDVRKVVRDERGRAGAMRMSVVFAGGGARGTVYTLGIARFVGDRPERTIVMYPHAAAALVDGDLAMRSEGGEASPASRELIVGRVLGRALAHEIGHVLLQSRGHASRGLMRPRPTSTAFTSPDRQGFRLLPGEVTALRCLLRFSN
jgi:hypothetical protein